jgi:acetylornithine/N-succinyldiaminopimelate aminotransferase
MILKPVFFKAGFLCNFVPIKKSFLKHIAQTSPTPPMYNFVRGEGIFLYDKHGKPYVDLISGIAVNNLGHNHPKVTKAIKKQVDQFSHQMVYGEYVISPQVKLAKRLVEAPSR